jgi:hypothetical protein
VLWIRIRIRIRMDPHKIERKDPDLDRIKLISWIRIRFRIKVISWIQIRIRINLQTIGQNVLNMSHLTLFKVLNLHWEARIRIRIKVKGRIQIRIRSDEQDPDPHQNDEQDPVPHQSDADPQHCF